MQVCETPSSQSSSLTTSNNNNVSQVYPWHSLVPFLTTNPSNLQDNSGGGSPPHPPQPPGTLPGRE